MRARRAGRGARSSAPAGTRRGVTFAAELEPTLVEGVPARLDRAVGEPARQRRQVEPAGRVVDVRLRDGELTVRDHGPGIAGRRPRARLRPLLPRRRARAGGPGSGLGLAIVRQVAEAHGGTVAAEAADGGGALLRAAPAGPLSNFLGSAEGASQSRRG